MVVRADALVVAILVRNHSVRKFERCLDVAWVLSMTLKGSYGTPRRALLAQTGVCGASIGTSETGGGTAEVRQVALDRSLSSVSFAEHDENC